MQSIDQSHLVGRQAIPGRGIFSGSIPSVCLKSVPKPASVMDHPILKGLVSEQFTDGIVFVQAHLDHHSIGRPSRQSNFGHESRRRLVVLVRTAMSMQGTSEIMRLAHDLVGPQGVLVYLPENDEGSIGKWLISAMKVGFPFAQAMQGPDPAHSCPLIIASRSAPVCSAGTRLKFA